MTAKRIPGVQTVDEILQDMDAARGIGDNQPPEPTPFELARDKINEWHAEAKLWLDGAEITTQAQADDVGKIIKGFSDAWNEAEAARKAEKKPFDDGAAEVQRRYKPIQKIAEDGEAMARRVVAKFMAAQEDLRIARAREAQAIAYQQAEEARQAIADANAAGNLAAREDAEQLVVEAAETAKLANALDKGKTMVATGGARRLALRSVWTATITDRLEAMRTLWRLDASAFDELITKLGNERVKAGMRELAGFEITETHIV